MAVPEVYLGVQRGEPPPPPSTETPPAEAPITQEEIDAARQRMQGAAPTAGAPPAGDQAPITPEELATARARLQGAPAPTEGPTWGQQIQGAIETAAPAVGGIIGGTAGAALGPLGAVGGAALGATTGAVVSNLTRNFLDPNAQQTMLRQWIDAFTQGATGAVGEGMAQVMARGVTAAGQVGTTVLKKALAPEGATAAAQVAAPELAKKGVGLTLGQTVGTASSALTNFLEGVARNAIFGSGRIREFLINQKIATNQMIDDLSSALASRASDSQVARSIVNIIDGGEAAFKAAAKVKYQLLDQVTKKVYVNTSTVLRFLRGARDRQDIGRVLNAAFPEGHQDFLTIPLVNNGQVVGRVRQIPFSRALEARTRLLRLAREKSQAVDPAMRNLAGMLASKIKDATTAASSGLSATGKAAYDDAVNFYAHGMRQFGNRLIRQIVTKLSNEPSKLDILLQKNTATRLVRVMDSMGSPAFNTVVRPKLMSRVLERATDPATGEVTGHGIHAALKSLGEETSKVALGAKRLDALRNLATVLTATETRAGGTGTLRIAIAQAVGVGLLAIQPLRTIGAGVAPVLLIAPSIAGRLFTNENFVKAMATGISQYRRNPKLLERTVAQIAAQLARAGVQSASESSSSPEASGAPMPRTGATPSPLQ